MAGSAEVIPTGELLHSLRRVAIIKLSSLGDVLHASAAAAAVKRTEPDAFCAWVVDSRFADLLRGNPHIDELIVVPWQGGLISRLRGLVAAGRRLRQLEIELAIDLQGLFKSAVVAWFSHAAYKACARDAREGARLVASHYITCAPGLGGSDKQLGYVASLGANITGLSMELTPTPKALASARQLLADAGLPKQAQLALIVPSTTRETKLWPAKYFAELIPKLRDELHLDCLLLGTQRDSILAGQIASAAGGKTWDFCGKTDLQTLIALGSLGKVCIGGDTGPVFICAAAGTPTVAIFGSTLPAGKLPAGPQFVALRVPMECSPCRKTTCPSLECLKAVKPAWVFEAVRQVLAAPPGT